jgi:NAD(P)H-dependent FMN reductase
MLAYQGLLIASLKYNSSILGVLKNAIDWASRPESREAPLACFVDNAAVIISASPGTLGGRRGLVHVRAILENIKVIVLPDQIAVPKAYEAFNSDGILKDPKQHAAVEKSGSNVGAVLAKLRA